MSDEFVIELYNLFHERLRQPVKDFEEIQSIYQKFLQQLMSKHKTKKIFTDMPRKHDINTIYEKLVKEKRLLHTYIFDIVLTSKIVRSSSGILPISIALDGKQGSCSDDCSMCPNECKAKGADEDIARSYLSSEGTFIRGKIQKFSVVEQTWRRLAELETMGHPPDKLEFILLGGTFDCYPREYRYQVSLDIFYACNTYCAISTRFKGEHSNLLQKWLATNPFATNSPLSSEMTDFLYQTYPRPLAEGSDKEIGRLLSLEQAKNTKSNACRAIGIVFETRPDRVNRFSLIEMRKFGCTRIQIGIQTDDDEVLAYNNRGHTFATSVKANREIRDNGFKLDGHIMPDLPGTTLEIDYKMVQHIFQGSDCQLDYCKIYPTLDLPYTLIRTWKQTGKWQAIAETRFPEFLDFLAYTMSIVPPWTRVNRVQRDFPEATIKNNQLGFVSETIKTNLQQIVTNHLEKKGWKCYDIRSREVRNEYIDLSKVKLYIRMYRANEGTEFFISVENPKNNDFDHTNLLGLCRLRIPDHEFSDKETIPFHYLPVYRTKTDRIARIRELHVYGTIASLSTVGNSQHRGIGKFLIRVAESISSMYDCTLVTVISGVGVRDYYEHLGYSLDTKVDQFMIKEISAVQENLTLFGKHYDREAIRSAVLNSIISKKYIKKVDVSNKKYETHTYTTIQQGEAQGFSFEGYKKESISYIYFLVLILFFYVIYKLY